MRSQLNGRMGKTDKLVGRQLPINPTQIIDTQEDRRLKGERVHVTFPIYMTYKGSLIQGYTQAINLSWAGMRIETNFPLNVGDRVQLEFTLPEHHIPISIKAKVIHKINERTPEEATELGLAFEELEPNIQRMLSGFVLEYMSTD